MEISPSALYNTQENVFKSENREIWKTKNGVFLNGTLRCVSLIIYHLKNDFKRKFISVTIVKEEN